jgi:hypothetical protein
MARSQRLTALALVNNALLFEHLKTKLTSLSHCSLCMNKQTTAINKALMICEESIRVPFLATIDGKTRPSHEMEQSRKLYRLFLSLRKLL